MKQSRQAESAALVPQLAPSTIGLDLGDRWSRYCVVDENGVTDIMGSNGVIHVIEAVILPKGN